MLAEAEESNLYMTELTTEDLQEDLLEEGTGKKEEAGPGCLI